MILRRNLAACFTLSLAVLAPAQLKLLKDVNRQRPGNPSANPGPLIRFGSWLYCAAERPETGRELFRVHAVSGKPELVRDLNPGSTGSNPRSFVSLGGRLLFVADDGSSGFELWSTDGTATGTRLVVDLRPGREGSGAAEVVVVGRRAYFAADDGRSSRQLWSTDGTAAGTTRLTSVAAGASPERLVAWNDRLIFDAVTPAHGREPWTSDGTVAGTRLVRDLDGLPRSSLDDYRRGHAIPFEKVFALIASTSSGSTELWVSDATRIGTRRVRSWSFSQSNLPARVVGVHRNRLWLAAESVGQELWISDGTASGTTLLADIHSNGSSQPGLIAALGGIAYFAATDTDGRTLYRSDGTPAGTFRVRTRGNGRIGAPTQLVVSGGTLFLEVAGPSVRELWATDGSQTSTFLRHAFAVSGRVTLGALHAWPPGSVVFAATDRLGDRELWTARSATNSTRLWSEIAPRPGSTGHIRDRRVIEHDGRAFFSADDGIHGPELWVSDYSSAGTRLLKDVQPGSIGSSPYGLTSVGGHLFFAARQSNAAPDLWTTDGTATGTKRVPGLPPQKCCLGPQHPVAFRGKLFFLIYSSDKGAGLWSSDGTVATPVFGLSRWSGAVPAPCVAGDRLFFYWSGFPRGLYVSDGTTAVTKFVGGGLAAKQLFGWRGRAFYEAGLQYRLWGSDGTSAGTKELHPTLQWPTAFTPLGDALYFVAFDNGGHGLWRTDGTTIGTTLVRQFARTVAPSMTRVGDKLLLSISTAVTGQELFVSDGTSAGTRLLADVRVGPGDGVASGVRSIGSRHAYFFGRDEKHGVEPWITDGTTVGTKILQDVRSGALSSNRSPRSSIAEVGGLLFVNANDGASGEEWWLLDPGATARPLGQPCGPGLARLSGTDPVLGRTMSLRMERASLGTAALLQLGSRPRSPARLGFGCSLWVDLTQPIVNLDARLVTRATWSLQIPVPNDASLAGSTILSQYWQLPIGPSGSLGLTNGLALRLGR